MEINRGSSNVFPGFLRPGEAHCRSLGCARDDKGRVQGGYLHLAILQSRMAQKNSVLVPRLADF